MPGPHSHAGIHQSQGPRLKNMFASRPLLTARLGMRLVSMSRLAKVGVMLASDLAALPFCSMIAMLLRVGDVSTALSYGIAPHFLIALFTIPVFLMSGLYGAVIRFIDQRLLTATGIGLAIVVVSTYLLSSFFNYKGMPHSVLMIYWFIAFSYVVTSRLMARSLLRNSNPSSARRNGTVAAIYGAGEAGVKLALAMRVSDQYRAVCFFDDKHSLHHRNAVGLKIFHSDRLIEIVNQKHIELIVIAIPSATPEQRREIMYRAHKTSASVKILCGLMELRDEEISAHSIREIKIDDLLGRDPIHPDLDLFAKCVRKQNVLVTGAGGSIGSELCRQVMTLMPNELHLLDHSEQALYCIEQELRTRFPGMSLHPHLGSVCDASLVARIMTETKIDTVYHAAAYKHVPLVEHNMAEGIRNNVLGAEVIANAASRFHVKTCVLISTDKAVRPTSIMGASKRIAELIFQAAVIKGDSDTRFCMVRFGNVLGSSGSVVPLFKSQIERGGPITITHPDVVRYFMSIPEAAQLVMQAGAMATGGDVFVMDMGEPVKIVDLARTMIAMYGLVEKDPATAQGDIEIRYVGLRPGEKLYEELFAGDTAIPSKHPRIMTTTEYVIAPDALAQQIAYLLLACATNDRDMIKFLVHKLVRGYAPGSTGEPQPNESLQYKFPLQPKRNPVQLVDRINLRS
jgi:FlaA1/EpsC-like NDP-sugar epimerase